MISFSPRRQESQDAKKAKKAKKAKTLTAEGRFLIDEAISLSL
jgi:hypothetical protein